MTKKDKKRLNEINSKIMDRSKKLAYRVLKKYFLFAVPILALEIAILTLLWFFANSSGYYLSMVFASINGLVFLTYFAIFDGTPARSIKKNNFKVDGSNITREQGIVFYNSLKLRTIHRGLFNFMATLLIIGFSVLYMVV